MSLLGQQFIRELVIRGMSERTQWSYVYWVHQLAKHYHLAPDQLSDEQVKVFLQYLVQELEGALGFYIGRDDAGVMRRAHRSRLSTTKEKAGEFAVGRLITS